MMWGGERDQRALFREKEKKKKKAPGKKTFFPSITAFPRLGLHDMEEKVSSNRKFGKNSPMHVRIFFLNLREIERERRDQIKTLKVTERWGKFTWEKGLFSFSALVTFYSRISFDFLIIRKFFSNKKDLMFSEEKYLSKRNYFCTFFSSTPLQKVLAQLSHCPISPPPFAGKKFPSSSHKFPQKHGWKNIG